MEERLRSIRRIGSVAGRLEIVADELMDNGTDLVSASSSGSLRALAEELRSVQWQLRVFVEEVKS